MKTMVYLDEKVHERLIEIGFHHKPRLSMAELVRRAVDEYLSKNYPKKGGRKR